MGYILGDASLITEAGAKFAPGAVGKLSGNQVAQYAAQAGAVLTGYASPFSLLAIPVFKILGGALSPPDPFKNCFDGCTGEKVGKILRSSGAKCWDVFPNTLDFDFVGNLKGEYYNPDEIIKGYNSGYLNRCVIDRYNEGTGHIDENKLVGYKPTSIADTALTGDIKKKITVPVILNYLH